MNTTSPVDYEVNIGTPASAEETDGPFAQLFCDRTVGGGVRVLAVAEPMQRTGFGYFTAAAALAAFEETLIVALKDGVSNGLARAFKSANDAVRRGNSRSEGGLRAHAGITSIVIEGQAATIGFIPPGQALLVQDGQLYAIPDLQSWAPGFMPCADVDEPEPLGFGANVRPLIRTTQIGSGDQLLLGASSVGRALTNPALGPIRELSEATIMNRDEAGLAAS
jgi:hypothetical protein